MDFSLQLWPFIWFPPSIKLPQPISWWPLNGVLLKRLGFISCPPHTKLNHLLHKTKNQIAQKDETEHNYQPLNVPLALKPSIQRPPFDLLLQPPHYCSLFFFFPFFTPIHPSLFLKLPLCLPKLQVSQHALTTGSFNAAAISSRLMSSAGGASPSSLEQWVREGGMDGESERELKLHSVTNSSCILVELG